MSVKANLDLLKSSLPEGVSLIAVTKTQAIEKLQEAYSAGHKIFGENKVQELCEKQEQLPKDIEWHLIGHLQRNKVKYIASFVKLIHSVDSFSLLEEIDKQAKKNNRVIDCLLQIYIATEETKFGLDFTEAKEILESRHLAALKNIRICGLMGMASNTEDRTQIRKEFNSLKNFFEKQKSLNSSLIQMQILSMGMSSDYKMAVEEGSTMIRVGSAIFGTR